MESQFAYMRIELIEEFDHIKWDVMKRYIIDDTHGETKYYILTTPLSYMTKRKIIKRLVEMSGERSRKRGRLSISFGPDQEKEASAWIDSLRLMNKIINT